jgi:outer membrane protein OmpA-like peptidoglycan-associated protein
MAFEFTGMRKFIVRGAAVAVVAFGASACSVMPEWMGGDAVSANTAEDQADQQMAANQSSPDLNSVPDKPPAPSTADDQKALTDSLSADRAQNQYSADQLRGGTEASAAPPGAPPPPDQTVAANAPPPAAAPPPASSDSGSVDAAAAANAGDQAAPAPVPPSPAAAADSSPPPPAAATQQTAMNSPPPAMAPTNSGPAVPMGSYGSYGASMVSPSDAALGFKPSMAPPLSPSVAQFVPQPIIARYQQTAAMGRASYSTASEGSYSAAPVSNRGKAMGGPEHMSGAVVANFDSLNAGGTAMPADGMYGTPSAVVMFAGDRTILDTSARGQVRAAAAAFQQSGDQGFIRVVGHASDAGDLSSERHQVLNFEHSQARATAVARELIKDGVPADKVLVETGAGAESGASAEIFLQS